jgi:hypothetical protein
VWYLALKPGTSDEAARAAFREQYGYEAERIRRLYPSLEVLIGPIRDHPSTNVDKSSV